MDANTRFTIMTFPQYFDGDKKLSINFLFMPRNQNPFSNPVAEVAGLPGFVDANLSFQIKIITGTELFPNQLNFTKSAELITKKPQYKKTLFTSLADPGHFNIDNLSTVNDHFTMNNPLRKEKANEERSIEKTVKKYLPVSYRQSFNFIAPVLPGNGVTDDSYHCAVRAAKYVAGFTQTTNVISWGKVFAYILRNRLLAEEAGFIYQTTLEIDVNDFKNGGWLYIDLAEGSDYKQQQDTDQQFIKRYAAKIPALKAGQTRPLFAPNLFPVLLKTGPTDPTPGVGFDNIFIEASEYDDGFSKLVHAFQPVSQNILQEESDGFHPTNESGIRLGWDDEQLLSWYVRMMAKDPVAGVRLDAPSGVFGYHIDVRKNKSGDAWESLNAVQTKEGIDLLQNLIPGNLMDGSFNGELPFQVYPSTLDGDKNKNYWLPMYFGNWNGHSMVLPDEEAIRIYQHNENVQPDTPDPLNPENKGKTNVTGAPQNNLLKIYEPLRLNTKLKYGQEYDFRVRMTDMTHGGPLLTQDPVNDATTPVGYCHFKRYVAPSTIRIDGVIANEDGAVFNLPSLTLQRPLLGYPAVAFCGGYADAVTRLTDRLTQQLDDAKNDPEGKRIQMDAIGLTDPDVDSVEITVEVQALKMDYQLSVSGKESFALLYTTIRKFETPANEDDFEKALQIPINYQDAHTLNFGDATNLGDLIFDPTTTTGAIEIPTARAIRLTIRAVCENKPGYYGLEKDDPAYNSRYGRTLYVNLYKESADETDLYLTKSLQAIYLQPDDIALVKPVKAHIQKIHSQPIFIPDCVQRLAQQLKITNSGLTMVGNAGQRIQFGCSARIRHTLSPDNASLTFASKAELYHHWLNCIKIDIKRDWTWDALEDTSFVITRKTNFKETPGKIKEEIVGEIDIKHTISFTALQDADRTHTTVLFIDAVEPKKEEGADEGIFPDIIEVNYTVTPKFKNGHGALKEGETHFETLQLPVTINPTQIPKIASAGIALSPYYRSEKYASTEPRQRFLWIEFDEPVMDPNDTYFARVLAYAPDQLISNNNHALEKNVAEPPINIDPEYIRVINAGSPDDNLGIDAMQPMEKAIMGDKHYLLPLPPGLNESSAELFGFFTYEIRIGHSKIWSTAQGRFGRPLKATGIQHPAPTLTCAVNRDEEKLYVTAPYARAVFNGKNVTANPPRTELWCLLYAQVKQADNDDSKKELKDYRNILLDDRMMHWGFKLNHDPEDDDNEVAHHNAANSNESVSYQAPTAFRPITKQLIIEQLGIKAINAKFLKIIPLTETIQSNADATKYGTTFWTNEEVADLLNAYGLPADLSLSVLCVEIFTNITSEQQYRTRSASNADLRNEKAREEMLSVRNNAPLMATVASRRKPLSDGLGNYRILRTSPLCEVPFVCCS